MRLRMHYATRAKLRWTMARSSKSENYFTSLPSQRKDERIAGTTHLSPFHLTRNFHQGKILWPHGGLFTPFFRPPWVALPFNRAHYDRMCWRDCADRTASQRGAGEQDK